MRGTQINIGEEVFVEGLYWNWLSDGRRRFELVLDEPTGLRHDGFIETEEGATEVEIESFIDLWLGKVAARIGRAVKGVE